MAIKIKRSSGNDAPSTLEAGQLAYSEGNTNGGTLYYGEIGGTVRPIGGRKYVEAIDNINATIDNRIGAADLEDLANVQGTPSDGQVLAYNSPGGYWEPAAPGSGATTFTQLNDTPANYTGAALYWLRVNAAGNGVEFVQHIDDGTF